MIDHEYESPMDGEDFFSINGRSYATFSLKGFDYVMEQLSGSSDYFDPGATLIFGNWKYRSHIKEAWDAVERLEQDLDIVLVVKSFDCPAPSKGALGGSGWGSLNTTVLE